MKNKFFENWKQKADLLKREVYVIYLSLKDPRMPWHAKILAFCIVGYAFSPIDLIPDFIPVLGYLDDFVLVPLFVILLLKLIPSDIMNDARNRVQNTVLQDDNIIKFGTFMVVSIWFVIGLFFIILAIKIL